MFKIRHDKFVYNEHILFLNKSGATLFRLELLNNYKVIDFKKWDNSVVLDVLIDILSKIDGNHEIDILLDENLSNLRSGDSKARGKWSVQSVDGITSIEISSIFDSVKHILDIEDIVIEEVIQVFSNINHNIGRLILTPPNEKFRYNVYFLFKSIGIANTASPIPNVSFATHFPKFVFGEYLKKSGRLANGPQKNGGFSYQKNTKNINTKKIIMEAPIDERQNAREYFILLDESIEASGLALLEIYKKKLEESTVLEVGAYREKYPSSLKRMLPNILTKDINKEYKSYDSISIINESALVVFGSELIPNNSGEIFGCSKNEFMHVNYKMFSSSIKNVNLNKDFIKAAHHMGFEVSINVFKAYAEKSNVSEILPDVKINFFEKINEFNRREMIKNPSEKNLLNLIRSF